MEKCTSTYVKEENTEEELQKEGIEPVPEELRGAEEE